MRTNNGKRLYVFGAVALAVFVGLMTLTGILCDGYATAGRVKAARDAELNHVDTGTVERAKAKLAAAETATAEALRHYEKVHAGLTAFLAQHFAELMTQGPATSNDANDSTAEDSPKADEPVKTEANPALEKANQQLSDLRRRRSELLTNLTETHPLVRQVELAIGDLEAQLKQIASATAATKPETEQQKPAIDIAATKKWQETEEQYRSLLQEVGVAEKSYHAALKTENSDLQSYERLAAAAKSAPTKLVTAGGANPRLAILLCGLIATAAGVLVARFARIPESTFHTVAEVRHSLGIAVLGVLPRETHVQPRERPRQELKWVRRAVMVAELSLVAAVAVIAISAVADREFLFDLIADPLAACSNKFWC
jgi:hypothetical protein